MNKAYTRIDWENEPSTDTPINETNLNKMDSALDELDNRVIAQDTSKADKTEVSTLIANVEFDESTGIITVTRKNGSSFTIDTKLEKIAINFTYDKDTQQIILTLVDGTNQYIDLSALITQYEFLDSDTITFVVQADGSIKADVLDGSITENKLQPNYLAQIKVETAKSETYMNNASSSATQAKSYAVGGTGTREGEDTDNAEYYYQQAKGTDVGQLRQDVDEINRNLDEIGTVNTFNSNAYIDRATISPSGQIEGNSIDNMLFYMKVKSGNKYTFSYTASTSLSGNCLYGYTTTIPSIGKSCTYNTVTITELNGKTFVAETDGYLCIRINVNMLQNITNIIFSDRGIGDIVTKQNASLGDYGLNNVFDGELEQGYISDSGGFVQSNRYVSSKNYYSINASEIVKIKRNVLTDWFGIAFYTDNKTFISISEVNLNSKEYSYSAPSDAKYFKFYIGYSSTEITPSTAGHIGVYVNNQIDELKNDLDCKVGLFPSTGELNITFDSLRLIKQNDMYVLQFYNEKNWVGQIQS